MFLLLSFFLCIFIVTLGGMLLDPTLGGFQGSDSPEWSSLVICAIAIYAGILSSMALDRIDKGSRRNSKIFYRRDMVVAAMVAPLVFLAVYPLMRDGQDEVIKILMAYQNGFLFKSIMSRLRGGVDNAADS